jgi:hypothetical protein
MSHKNGQQEEPEIEVRSGKQKRQKNENDRDAAQHKPGTNISQIYRPGRDEEVDRTRDIGGKFARPDFFADGFRYLPGIKG